MQSLSLGALLLVLSGTAFADRWVDKPSWPKTSFASIRWVLQPDLPYDKTSELPKRPVTVEITTGDVTRAIVLDPQRGQLKRDYQPSCANGTNAFALEHKEVAKLTFFNAGYGGYVISRSGDVLSVIGWDLEDGACPDKHGNPVACPRKDKLVAKIHIPASWKLDEQIVEADGHGSRTAYSCTDR